MKKTVLFFLFFTLILFAQDKYTTNSAVLNFEASVPLFEEISAVNRSVIIGIDPKTSSLMATVLIEDFRFKLDLMQEHFNQNYMETHRYPKAFFKGKILKFDLKDINEIEKEYQIKGRLMVRGKVKDIEVKALLKKVNDGIQIICDFPIVLSDFMITFPDRIADKIAKTANTSLKGVLRNHDVILLTSK